MSKLEKIIKHAKDIINEKQSDLAYISNILNLLTIKEVRSVEKGDLKTAAELRQLGIKVGLQQQKQGELYFQQLRYEIASQLEQLETNDETVLYLQKQAGFTAEKFIPDEKSMSEVQSLIDSSSVQNGGVIINSDGLEINDVTIADLAFRAGFKIGDNAKPNGNDSSKSS